MIAATSGSQEEPGASEKCNLQGSSGHGVGAMVGSVDGLGFVGSGVGTGVGDCVGSGEGSINWMNSKRKQQ